MFKNKFKKLTGFFLAAVMTLVALPIHTLASEWGVGDNVYAAMLGNYIGSDGGTYGDKRNYTFIYYKADGDVATATRVKSNHAKLGVSKNGVTQQAICIEAGVSYSTGSSYVGKASSDDYMLMLPTKARRAFNISGVTVTKSGYDYTFSTSTKINGTKACTYKANRTTGKQLVVWKSNGDSQTMADGIDDPVQFYANFKTSNLGTAQIKKVWEQRLITQAVTIRKRRQRRSLSPIRAKQKAYLLQTNQHLLLL